MAQNTVLNLIGQMVPVLIGLVSIPLLIRHIGMDRFGLLSLVWVVISYFTFFDLGLDQAIVKLVAEKIGANQESEIPSIFWNALFIMTVMSAVGSCILFGFSPFLVKAVFKIPDALQSEAIKSFYCLSASLVLVTLTAGFRGVLEARQRFDFANLLYSLMGASTFVGPLIVSFWTSDLFILVLMLLIVRLLIFIAHVMFVFRLYPELRDPAKVEKATLKRLFKFATWMTVSNIVSPIMVYFDRFILSAIVPLDFLAYYTTPYEVVNRLLVIPGSVVRTVFPTFAFLGVEKSRGVEIIFIRCIKLIFFVLFPTILAVVYFGHDGLNLWLGTEFAQNSTRVMQILAVGILLNGIAFIPTTLLQSAERPDLSAKIHLLEFPFYLPAVWIMSNHYGLIGAAIAFTVRVSIDMFLLFGAVCWVIPSLTKELIRLLLPLLSLLIFLIPPFFPLSIHQRLSLAIAIVLAFAYVFWSVILHLEDRLDILSRVGRKLSPSFPEMEPDEVLPNERIWAVISSFNPSDALFKNIESYLDQVEKVIVIDNGSARATHKVFSLLEHPKIQVIRININRGRAAAINLGLGEARAAGISWIVTFAQDHHVGEKYVENLLMAARSSRANERLMAVSPRSGSKISGVEPSQDTVSLDGALISVNKMFGVGLLDESLYASYVDEEFFLRASSKLYTFTQATEARLHQGRDGARTHGNSGLSYSANYHKLVGRYYLARNRVRIYRKFFIIFPNWVLSDARRFVADIFLLLFNENERSRKLLSIFRGLLHGARNQRVLETNSLMKCERPDQRIGIVLATFQPPLDFFRDQLESVRDQTVSDWFVIITDDGSTPDLLSKIEELADEVLGVDSSGAAKYSVRKNSGVKGVVGNFADGLTALPNDCKLVCFCDQDDLWVPDKLMVLRQRFVDPDVSLVHSDMRVIDDIGREIHPSCWSFEGRDVNRTDPSSLILRNTVSGCAMMFRREVLDFCLPFPDQPRGRPWFYHDVWIALGAAWEGKIRAVPRALISYRQHGNNVVGAERGLFSSWEATTARRSSVLTIQKIETAWRSRSVLEESFVKRANEYQFKNFSRRKSPTRVFSVDWDFGFFAFILAAKVAFRSPRYLKIAVLIAFGKFFSDFEKLLIRLGFKSAKAGVIQ